MLSKLFKIILHIATFLCICLVTIAILISRPTLVTKVEDETENFLNTEKLKEHVIFLSQQSIPRDSNNPDILDKASNYIKNELSTFTNNVSFQEYNIGDNKYRNVIASFGPKTDEVIIVGAHYDTYLDLPGADDNASGVSGLIELGRLLSKISLTQQVLLIAYTLEEPPHFASHNMGSYIHASSLMNKKVKMMISLEMIGYYSQEPNTQSFPVPLMNLIYPSQGNYIVIVDKFTSNNAIDIKSSINKYTELPAYSINAPRFITGIDFSDHRNYWDFNFPAVMVTDTSFYRNKAYHTEYDTYDRLNYKLMAKVVFGVFKYIEDMNAI